MEFSRFQDMQAGKGEQAGWAESMKHGIRGAVTWAGDIRASDTKPRG